MFPFFLYHYVFSFLLIILCLKFFIKNKQKLPWSYVSAKLLYICPLSFMVKLHESNRAWKKICITNDTSPSVLSATHWYLTFPLLLHRKVSSYEHQWSSFYQILSSILCSCFIWLVRFFSKVEILLYILSSFSFHNTVMVPLSRCCLACLLGSLSSWDDFCTLEAPGFDHGFIYFLSIHCTLGLNPSHDFMSTWWASDSQLHISFSWQLSLSTCLLDIST